MEEIRTNGIASDYNFSLTISKLQNWLKFMRSVKQQRCKKRENELLTIFFRCSAEFSRNSVHSTQFFHAYSEFVLRLGKKPR